MTRQLQKHRTAQQQTRHMTNACLQHHLVVITLCQTMCHEKRRRLVRQNEHRTNRKVVRGHQRVKTLGGSHPSPPPAGTSPPPLTRSGGNDPQAPLRGVWQRMGQNQQKSQRLDTPTVVTLTVKMSIRYRRQLRQSHQMSAEGRGQCPSKSQPCWIWSLKTQSWYLICLRNGYREKDVMGAETLGEGLWQKLCGNLPWVVVLETNIQWPGQLLVKDIRNKCSDLVSY